MKKFKKLVSMLLIIALTLINVPASITTKAGDYDGKVRVIVRNDTYLTKDGAAWDGVLIDTWVDLKADSTGNTVFADAVAKAGKSQTGAESGYVTEINGLNASDSGYMGGWMATLNDWFTSSALGDYTVAAHTLQSGDEVTYAYSCNWGEDLGSSWSGTDTSLKALELSQGTLHSSFDSEKKEYTLTIDDTVKSVLVTPTALNKNYQVKVYKDTYTPLDEAAAYKRSQMISIQDGTKLYIGVGNVNWPSMNAGQTETVYTITVKAEHKNPDEGSGEEAGSGTGNESGSGNGSGSGNESGTEGGTGSGSGSGSGSENKPGQDQNSDHYHSLNDWLSDNTCSQDQIPGVGSVNGEWKLLGLARSGKVTADIATGYYRNVADYVTKAGSAKLNRSKSTDNSRVILALSALGYDVTDVNGYNLLEPLADFEYVTNQGINGAVWALLALDSANYEIPQLSTREIQTTRESLIDYIVSRQNVDGSFSLDGKNSDVDVTAMAIQALHPYRADANIDQACNKAIGQLILSQNQDGSFGSNGVGNCESTAQAIIAFATVGINPNTDARLMKNGKSAVAALDAFYLGNGAFAHTVGEKGNQMSTEQARLALVAYTRLLNNAETFYRFSDVEKVKNPVVTPVKDQDSNQGAEMEEGKTGDVNASTPGDNSNTKAPETGDTDQAWIYMMLLLLSAGAAVAVVTSDRRKSLNQ